MTTIAVSSKNARYSRILFLPIAIFIKICVAFVFGFLDPLINRLENLLIKRSEAQKQRPHELL